MKAAANSISKWLATILAICLLSLPLVHGQGPGERPVRDSLPPPLFSPHFILKPPVDLSEPAIPRKAIQPLPARPRQAFFCRLEQKAERRSNVAIRVRLGSLEEANRLEGKESRGRGD